MTEPLKSDLLSRQASLGLAGDLIWGVKAIAIETDRTERQAYHLLATRQLPAQLVGGRWVASRSGLRRHFAQILGGPAA
jgi:hypothetical protein